MKDQLPSTPRTEAPTRLTYSRNDHSIMTMTTKKRRIPAGKFKAKCLALLDEVAATGVSLVITKRGKPVARLGPLEEPPSLRGSVTYHGDIVAPLDVTWEAAR
jgi:prevent-host-death family protein